MRLARHVVSTGERLCWRNLSERDYFGDLDKHRWKNIIKKFIFRNRLGEGIIFVHFWKICGGNESFV